MINSGYRGPIRTDNAEFCGRLTISWGYLFSYTVIKLYGVLIYIRWLNNTKSLSKSSTIGQGLKYIVCRTRTSPLTSVSVTITQQYIMFSRASLAELRDVRMRCPISSTKEIFFLLMEFCLERRMIVRSGLLTCKSTS